MENLAIKTYEFDNLIKKAAKELSHCDFEQGYKTIVQAIVINPSAPEPQNLLGIWHELNKNDNLARKHYRAAYALDPTYQPASENLERVCTFFVTQRKKISYGEKIVEK